MSAIYRSLLSRAALVLFVVAMFDLLMVPGYYLISELLMNFSRMANDLNASPQFALSSQLNLMNSFFTGVNGAVLPFLGAALIWRADKFLKIHEAQK